MIGLATFSVESWPINHQYYSKAKWAGIGVAPSRAGVQPYWRLQDGVGSENVDSVDVNDDGVA